MNTTQDDFSATAQERVAKAAKTLKLQFTILAAFVLLFWSLEGVDALFGNLVQLDNYGIQPRSSAGLRGILTAPFLHVGFGHVASNTIPFIALGWFVMLRGIKSFAIVTAITAFVGGLGIWLFGQSNSIHLGASILVFGYFGYLLFNSIFERSLQAMTLTLVAVLLYGTMIWGILPFQQGVSWEGHLFGFIGGGITARLLADRSKQADEPEIEIEIGDSAEF